MSRITVAMRIALALAGLAIVTLVAPPASAQRSKGLSYEQIRNVMRAHAGAFNACHAAATRQDKQLHGPFLYQIEVDKNGKVVSARPYQPTSVASFDRCIAAVIKRARFAWTRQLAPHY